jgi:inosine-uridine nucleoside N-ribohydrolase
VQVGNTGPVQEFNIQVDPEAAKVVFEAGAYAVALAAHLFFHIIIPCID